MESEITLYIDEGGDPGVKDGLKFTDTRYEWFTLGAYVIRTSNEELPTRVVKTIMDGIKGGQSPDLHYARLSAENRLAACQLIAGESARGFCLLSHKTNVREHINPKLGQMKAGIFYNWCTRLLLERVMYWYNDRIREGMLKLAPMKIIFSERGGHDYPAMFSYFETLTSQARGSGFKLRAKCFMPEAMDRSYWSIERHEKLAGLQLADAVASSFYQAANRQSPNWGLAPAKALSPVIAENGKGIASDVGVTVWPLKHQAMLPNDSRSIFESYGYKF